MTEVALNAAESVAGEGAPSTTPDQAPAPAPLIRLTQHDGSTRRRPDRGAAGMAYCAGCGHTWTALGAAHCARCHRTFSTARLFDLHRSARGDHGTCLAPDTITSRDGAPVMTLRDGMYRGPEMTADQKLARFGERSTA